MANTLTLNYKSVDLVLANGTDTIIITLEDEHAAFPTMKYKTFIMKNYIRFLLFKSRLKSIGVSPLDIFFPLVSWVGVIGTVLFIWYLVNVL